MAKKFYFFIAFLLSSITVFAQTATLKGVVTDDKTNEPLPGATIHFDDYNNAVSADVNGVYSIINITPGEYKVKVKLIGYTEFEKKIKLSAGQEMVLNIQLGREERQLEMVNVYGTINKETDVASRSTEKNANNIVNVIGAQAILKSPDLNAANVLQRVSGVTIQRNSGGDDAYAVIRGIEPRYNNTLINGVKIASPDDKSRFVSLSVVPSELLQRIEVSKSLTPDMEGDAIGGTVNMVFKDAPDSLLFNASASIGYSAIFFDRKFTTFSKKDIQAKSVYDTKGPDYVATTSDFSRSNLDFKPVTAPPTYLFNIAYGNRFLHNKLGILIADNFQNQYFGNNSQLEPTVGDPKNNYLPSTTDIENRTFSNQQLNNGLVVHADYKINDRNQLSADNVLLYTYFAQTISTIDTTLTGGDAGRTIVGGKPIPGTGSVHEDFESTTNHQILENFKLNGKHILSNHFLLDWTGVFSDATQEAPDRASYTINKLIKYDSVAHTFNSSPYYYDGGSRIWQHNEDKDYDGIVNLSYKSKIGSSLLELKGGGLYRHKERNNYQNEYIMFSPGADNAIGSRQQFFDIYSARDSILNPNGTAGYDLNNYHAFENITAGYVQFKIASESLDIVGGVRAENTDQGYHFLQFELDAPDHVSKTYTDILPSLAIKYKLNDKTNIRASYFKSLARPGYYEILPISQPENASGNVGKGNPDLLHTTADNFDVRYEFFPQKDQQIFVGGFYKKLQDPIENSFISTTTYEPINSQDATIYGGEIIYNKYFGNFGINANYAYTHSDVNGRKLDPKTGDTTYQHRPLQGQPTHEANVALEYKNAKAKFFIQIAYQYNGKTLYRVNPDLGYDYYQQPQSFLSLSADKGIGRHFTIFGKFNNLLNTATIIKTYNLTTGNDMTKASGIIGIRYSH
ncbi:MAG TPA: TonB-dependent receptor [Mucilaginibacter sp.]